MELFLISGYVAVCIAIFTLLRIPLNRWTVPTASIGGILLVFALVQVLNFYHPYSGLSRQAGAAIPHSISASSTEAPLTAKQPGLVAWFPQNNLLRLTNGSAVEVTFDSIPGKVFSGKLETVLPMPLEDDFRGRVQGNPFEPPMVAGQPRIPVLIKISDSRYAKYASQLPAGSHASAAVYGEQFPRLALVRKTLLRMSAWTNYLTVFS